MATSLLERARYWQSSLLLPLLYMLALFGLSSIPGVIPDDSAPVTQQVFNWVPPQVQNLLHIPVYGGLALLWCWYLGKWLRTKPVIIAALVLTVGHGVFDEIHQSFVPGRYASLTDVLFNAIGACLGVLVFRWLKRSAVFQPAPE